MPHKIGTGAKRTVKRRHSIVRHVRVVTDAPPGKAFFVFGGPVCKNLEELLEAVRVMSPAQYEYHTVPRGNDFANWVRDVLGQKRLSARLMKAESQKETIKILDA